MKIPLLFKKLKAVSSCVWYRGSFYLTCVTLQIFSSTGRTKEDNGDINRAWDSIKENINISAK
jgi:hypothetical protein